MNTDFSQPFNPEAYAPSGKADMRFRRYVEKGDAMVLWHRLSCHSRLCLYTYEKETLFRIQELNPLLTGQYFLSYALAAYPGGTLQWAACFLTQFFYYPAVGTALLIAVWVCICLSCARPSGFPPSWSFLPCLVPAALLAGIVEMGYFIYYIKLQGYFFMASIGILAALSAVWVFSRTAHRNPYWGLRVDDRMASRRLSFIRAYALAGTGYMVVLCWRMPGTLYKNRVIPTVWGLLLLVGVPPCGMAFL